MKNEWITPAYEIMYEEELTDSKSEGIVLRHKKSGAKICVLSNEDDNKVFCVGFRTPPTDSTGVAHIIEHSVLCGSEKFPLKDPFVELIKGSLNTFLNAFTAPDRTFYPAASCNDQDFKNLMHVYMDAVFHPNIYHYKQIFEQEGWHYELENEDAELKINGIVYNEMKGAFSNPEQVLDRKISQTLFPDNAYGVVSGGDPDVIPELTYENYLDFHRTYYHPSNSYIYLYGNMEVKERLEWLDEEYLSKYDVLNVDSEIALQKPFGECREISDVYPVAEGDSTENKTYISYNIMVGSCNDTKLCMAMDLLTQVLFSPVGPLRQAVVQAGVAPDMKAYFNSDIQQTYLSISVSDTEADKKELFLSTIQSELERIVKEGVPERSLRAALNRLEFRYREADYGNMPKGLILGMMVLSGWMFNEKGAFEYLHGNKLIDELRKEIGSGYFEELIRTYMLHPEHATLFILKPQAGLTNAKEADLKKRLAEKKAAMSKEEIQEIIDAEKELRRYQEAPETPENLRCLPVLKREDLRKEALPLLAKQEKAAGLNVVTEEVASSGISYLKLYFDVHEVPAEEVGYLQILSTVLGYMDSENYSYLELDNEVNIQTGGIFTGLESIAKNGDAVYYRPEFVVIAKAVYANLDSEMKLIKEILFDTKLDDTVRLKEIFEETCSKKRQELNSAAYIAAMRKALSAHYESDCYEDRTSGIAYYRFLQELTENFDSRSEEIITTLEKLRRLIFRKENLIVNIGAEKEGIEQTKASLQIIADCLPGESREGDIRFRPANFGFELNKDKEAYTCPGQIQYVAKCGNFFEAGQEYTGAMNVMNNILSINYLWDRVRVHGGAYGCFCNYSSLNGTYYIISYRDPNLTETIEVFDNAWKYLESFDADEREMTKLIIGTLSTIDLPMSAQRAAIRSFQRFMNGCSYELLQKERDEMLNATPEQIRALAPLIQKTMGNAGMCVVGSEGKIEENKELFDRIEKLF